ncbi:MAG: glycoside hydrolase family 127 protein [Thermoanaerobacterales bacterium]|nr:glycoside hydrolase family 127 protein [Thermoanaerobacterales bacterium]
MKDYKVQDPFWTGVMETVRQKMLPYQWKVLNDLLPDTEPSHCIRNFKIAAGLEQGQFQGYVFQDSDLAKWLEAVGFSLIWHKDPELESLADEAIDLIIKAQQPDGYINTYYTINGLDKRWTNLMSNHELYCAGHMIEAAIAYYYGTGKRKFLDAVIRFVDCIDRHFGNEPEKLKAYPGHEILELALVKLYKVTSDERYLNLSRFFVDERGKKPLYFEMECEKYGNKYPWKDSIFQYQYYQAGKQVREQERAEGHAVRAVYLYSGMAAVARECQDDSLLEACERLWSNITKKQMYITGAIGSQAYGESFCFDYILPNDMIYGETCAAIGLVFFARRMLEMSPKGEYADVMDRALYNGVLSGMSVDGTRFFYVNPLETYPNEFKYDHSKRHILFERRKWFACACCPPNIARMIASISNYACTQNNENFFVHLYLGGIVNTQFGDASLKIESTLPWQGKVSININNTKAVDFTLALRIPGWCRKYVIKLNGKEIFAPLKDGYISISKEWNNGDKIELNFDMPVEFNYANPNVREDVGKVAVSRGPIVYCLEEVDNGGSLHCVYVKDPSSFKVNNDDLFGGIVSLESDGYQLSQENWNGQLYQTNIRPVFRKKKLKFIPYFLWANRGVGEMTVWIRDGSWI